MGIDILTLAVMLSIGAALKLIPRFLRAILRWRIRRERQREIKRNQEWTFPELLAKAKEVEDRQVSHE